MQALIPVAMLLTITEVSALRKLVDILQRPWARFSFSFLCFIEQVSLSMSSSLFPV